VFWCIFYYTSLAAGKVGELNKRFMEAIRFAEKNLPR